MSNFENIVINDCIKKKKIVIKILTCIFIYLLVIGAYYYLPIVFNSIQTDNTIIVVLLFTVLMIQLFTMVIFPLAKIIYIRTYYLMNRMNPYVRNKKAKDINLKLEGLRKYIKDYSLLNQKDFNNITIWEDYLIYSVILGQNSKIVNEVLEKTKLT